jgi:hypothetical protein
MGKVQAPSSQETEIVDALHSLGGFREADCRQ